jgi:general stress protein 26
MKEHWTPWIKPWFPNGLEDPEAALMRAPTDSMEYRPMNTTEGRYGDSLYGPANSRAPLEATDRGQG